MYSGGQKNESLYFADEIMKVLLRIAPVLLFLGLLVFLYSGLGKNPTKLPSQRLGKSLPTFELSIVKDEGRIVTNHDLKGDIILINVWGTWCVYCKFEHKFLLKLSKRNDISLYGLNYRDKRELATGWLDELGDPYLFSLFDPKSRYIVDLGVYGAPETFVIDRKGVVRKRFAGVLDERTWKAEFEPLILKMKEEIKAEKA